MFSFVEIKFVVQLGSYQWGNGMHSLWHLRFIFFGISNSSRVQDDIDQVRMSSQRYRVAKDGYVYMTICNELRCTVRFLEKKKLMQR